MHVLMRYPSHYLDARFKRRVFAQTVEFLGLMYGLDSEISQLYGL